MILNQSYNQTHIADNIFVIVRCSYWSYTSFRYFLSHSCVFSQLYDKNFETDRKTFCRNDESITPFYNTIHRLVWWLTRSVMNPFSFFYLVIFSKENCIWSPCLLFITAWFSLDTSAETTSWIILIVRFLS